MFVCRTDAERELADELREAYLSYDFETLGRLLDETKPLRVSIPYYREDSETAKAIGDLPPLIEDEGLYRLNVRRYTSHFDRGTGFVVPDGGIDHQFI